MLESVSWVGMAAVLLGLAVGIGAFGAHGLRDKLDAYSMSVYERAVFYHFVHALGMLIVPILAQTNLLSEASAGRVCWLLLAGIILFSGSLYILAITGNRSLGMITPFGGVAFIAAWVVLAWSVLRGSRA
jgi:uncharacterized membrane protein YgdD (TMEM256/DUF423 family)